MTQVPDKPSLDEVMEHYGVMGMHWGVRRAKASSSQVRSARKRMSTAVTKIQNQEDINSQLTEGSKARIAGEKKVEAMDLAFLKNPDRVTAVRLTRGEKAAAIVLGLTLIPVVAPVIAIGATSARSRRIEYKQKTGAYNKK